MNNYNNKGQDHRKRWNNNKNNRKKGNDNYYLAQVKNNNNYPSNKRSGKVTYGSTPVIFRGNDMFHHNSFDGREGDLSGYVERVLIQIDSHGNKQIAKETQFVNSGRNMEIKINGHRSK